MAGRRNKNLFSYELTATAFKKYYELQGNIFFFFKKEFHWFNYSILYFRTVWDVFFFKKGQWTFYSLITSFSINKLNKNISKN